jgi:hypothetical protein
VHQPQPPNLHHMDADKHISRIEVSI